MNSDLPPPESLTQTQQRFVPLLLDPATLHLSSKEMADKAGYRSRTSWLVALQDDAFRAWVEALKQLSPPVPQSPVADALAGRIPIEQGLSPTQQRFWHVLQDPLNHTLSRKALCHKAGYTSDTP